MYTIFKHCPVFKNEQITLRPVQEEDVAGLLNCYSDQKAVPLFNADNCNGDTFYYPTAERMKQALDFWKYSYDTEQFVRMTIIWNSTNEIIGSVEMFNRGEAPGYGVHGVLRIDVMSAYEKKEVVSAVLELAHDHFYHEFGVEWIMTKAIHSAVERRAALSGHGYIAVKDFELPDYYGRVKKEL
ncbi:MULTISPECIES: GNAT family N-acetyltransferase [unclassified Paenibacillus]|uniref:GNAT family N-acetyltransferase n=1 Tax=unclassified Paenibacillus TaxID=185978 RepID=UPI0030F9E6EA